MLVGWEFPSNNHGRMDGFNDSGIHHFTERPIESMTREVLQDSLDAAVSNTKPVLVKFELYRLNSELFPKKEELKSIFVHAKKTWESNQETVDFFESGINVLENMTISVLAIRDYNTTGLENVDKKINGSFASLVKSVGVTFKDSSASGSFGIGKHAPFAVSSIRTMFYSTYNRQNVKAMQGVSKLASFDTGNSNFTQGTGYYGVKGTLEPILDLNGYSSIFSRNEYGTDKFIMGFVETKDWQDDVIETILLSYLVAIMEEKLEVHIVGLKINKINMPAILNYLMNKRPNSKVEQYYKAYTDPERVTKTHYFKTYDGMMEPITLSLLTGEGFTRRISVYRGTGMKIFEKDRFRAPIDFAGVMVVEGPKLNAVLRKMEPPTHDRWAASLYKDDQKYALMLLKKIYDWLNGEARELAKIQTAETIELRGLEGILPDLSKENESLKEFNNDRLNEMLKSFEVKKISIKPKEVKSKTKRNRKIKLDNQKIKEVNESDSVKKTPKIKKALISNVRSFCIDEIDGEYRFIVVAKNSGLLSFAIHVSGEDGSKTPVNIQQIINKESLEDVRFNGNVVGPLNVMKNQRLVLDISFIEKERYSLEVTV